MRKIYRENYDFFAAEVRNAPSGILVELGSGGGFLKEILPQAVTSDVLPLPGIDQVIFAEDLPFEDSTVGAIMMINVFHHVKNVSKFLSEARRCLKPGGLILMVEPANTLFSRFIYSNFHHEPFEPRQSGWELPPGGRMSSANDALPWIVFCRDRKIFEAEFPELRIQHLSNFMPFRYILSGGVSKPQLLPSFMYPAVLGLEKLLTPLNPLLGLFMKVAIKRV